MGKIQRCKLYRPAPPGERPAAASGLRLRRRAPAWSPAAARRGWGESVAGIVACVVHPRRLVWDEKRDYISGLCGLCLDRIEGPFVVRILAQ